MAIKDTGLTLAGLRAEFFGAFQGIPTQFQRLSTRIQSDKDTERYRWLGELPRMRQWVGPRLVKDLFHESYDVENLKYELTIDVDREEIEDEQTNQIRPRVQSMAQAAAEHKDWLIGQLLINGGTTGFNSYDGVTFFNDSHTSGATASQDNNLTQNIAAPTAPTVAEMKASLELAIQQLMTFTDTEGKPVNTGLAGMIAIVPPNMMFAAREALNATIIANTSNALMGMADVLAWPYLPAASDTWYLTQIGGPVGPFIFQDRVAPEFVSIDRSDDSFVLNTDMYRYGVRARYRMTYGLWQKCIRTVFT